MNNTEKEYKDMRDYCYCCSEVKNFRGTKCMQCSQACCKGVPQEVPTKYTPYDFNIGDYVEDVNGLVGYIKYGNFTEEKTKVHIDITITNSLDKSSMEYDGVACYAELHKVFKRIGQYDFSPAPYKECTAKPELKRIDIGNDIKTIDRAEIMFNECLLAIKINEIIDYINKEN